VRLSTDEGHIVAQREETAEETPHRARTEDEDLHDSGKREDIKKHFV
jgi:hypothetical protein